MPQYAFFKNRFVPLSEAMLPITTHAFHYGTACFEGIRANWNEQTGQLYLFRPLEHFQRLLKSAHILRIKVPFTAEELCDIAVELTQRSEMKQDQYIRPVAYKSAEAIGNLRAHMLEDGFLMFVIPFGNYLDPGQGIHCCTSSWRRVSDVSIPARAKVTGLYVNSVLAKTEAVENGFDEAIMLTHEGNVAEGTGENIFLVIDGKLVTPAATENILVGITRQTVIELAQAELGIETVERPVNRTELYIADECFLTGTAAHITAVAKVDHRKVGSGGVGPVTRALQELYFEIVRGGNEKYIRWCRPAYAGAAQR